MAIRDPLVKLNTDLMNVGGDSGAWGTILNKILGGDGTGGDPTGVDKWIEDLDSLKAPKAAPTFTGAVTFSGVQTAAAQPRAKVKKSGDQTLTNNVTTTLTWDQEDFDVGDLHDNATNNSRITVPTGGGGLWLVGYNVGFTSGTGWRLVKIRKNGTTDIATGTNSDVGSSVAEDMLGSMIDAASDADYYEIQAVQNSGGNEDVLSSISRFWAVKLF